MLCPVSGEYASEEVLTVFESKYSKILVKCLWFCQNILYFVEKWGVYILHIQRMGVEESRILEPMHFSNIESARVNRNPQTKFHTTFEIQLICECIILADRCHKKLNYFLALLPFKNALFFVSICRIV